MNNGKSYQVRLQPIGKRIEVAADQTLYDAARDAGINLASACGGEGNCGLCRVVLLVGDATPPTEDEAFTFTELELEKGLRLACCAIPRSDLTVQIPRESLISGQRFWAKGASRR